MSTKEVVVSNVAEGYSNPVAELVQVACRFESEIILEDAKRNASRIINESLLKAEKADMEAEMLKRNVNIFKRKLRGIIEAQLEMVEDIEKVEM